MQAGFLGIISNPEFPDRVKIMMWDELPKSRTQEFGEAIRYITKYNDILAAKTHIHNALNNQLLDADHNLYRATIIKAIAAIESNDDLRQEKIWVDSELNKEDLLSIEELTLRNRQRKKRTDFIIQLVGFTALAFLALNFFTSIV